MRKPTPGAVAEAILRGRAAFPKLRVARGMLARIHNGGTANEKSLQWLKKHGPEPGFTIVATCAAGFAVLGCMDESPADIRWAPCPVARCKEHHVWGATIAHLNDVHRWSPEKVAEWLKSLG